MKSIEPQALAAQTMQMILDNPDHHDQYALWHRKKDSLWHCETSHCWGGFGDAILRSLSIADDFENPDMSGCAVIYERLKKAYRMSDKVIAIFSNTENQLEDLQSYTRIFCDPIAELDTTNFCHDELLIFMARPDVTKDMVFFDPIDREKYYIASLEHLKAEKLNNQEHES